jgi:hypothetical protein
MKKSTVYIIFAAVAILAVIVLLSTTSTDKIDVIGKTSITSFKEILNTIQDRVSVDEMNGGWALTAPDESAKFIWSRDYSKSPLHDVMLEFSAQPFISAGLDLERLPDGLAFEGKIMVGTKLGNDVPSYDGEITPLSSYEQIVKLNRDSIKYHAALDHYGVSLADGNMFEWAKDMSKNDKDIVFVLNPEIFINAGVDPAKVEGWLFAKVKVEDANGKTIEVDKFLKPFDLK